MNHTGESLAKLFVCLCRVLHELQAKTAGVSNRRARDNGLIGKIAGKNWNPGGCLTTLFIGRKILVLRKKEHRARNIQSTYDQYELYATPQ